MSKFKRIAEEVGNLVAAKNLAYGNSFSKCGDFLQLLYPEGLQPAQYGDALTLVRMFDKQMRIATCKDAFGESPYRDLMGYALLGAARDKTAADYAPLEPEEVKAINASISPPSLCGTCIRQNCPVDCAEHTTECGEYLPQGGEVARVEVVCDNCIKASVCYGPLKGKGCEAYAAKPITALSLDLPSITVAGNIEDVLKKYLEEECEWENTPKGSLMELVECWDCVQVMQTFRERGGDPAFIGPAAPAAIIRYHDQGRPVAEAKTAMLMKNAARFYYSDEVNTKIILSGGKEW